MKITHCLLAVAVLLTTACVGGHEHRPETAVLQTPPFITGDSVVYGLACDGCTDTLLVLLRNVEGSPDTFNILNATLQRQVYGRPKIGDRMVLIADTDSFVATTVINFDQLRSTWCYKVTPTLRRHAGISEQMREQFLQHMPDSMRDSLFKPREYGFTLKSDGMVTPVGMTNVSNEGPTVYPKPQRYGKWGIANGRLVLMETRRDSLNKRVVVRSDTTQIVLLRRDTLVLNVNGQQKKYYRKQN